MRYLIILSLLLSGCMVGPNYRPPENDIPEVWTSDPCCILEPASADWWRYFNDPLLDKCIELAAHYNNDILIAEANIFQARALRQMVASSLFPQINGALSATRTYFSKNGPLFAIGGAETAQTPGLPFQIQIPQIQNIFTAMINVSWEIDLFGKVRREVEVAEAIIGSAIEQRNGALVLVSSEVAQSYIYLRSAQQKGVLIEENISLLEKELEIVKRRFQKGLIDRLVLEQKEAQLEELKSTLPPICAEIYRNIYALSILTGALPEALLQDLCPIASLPCPPCKLMCGMRSDLLRRRPDVRQAERDLAAATAQIGVAIASFFPSFSLSGDVGLQSLQLRKLLQGKSLTWAIGGAATFPIFQGGYLIGNLYLSEAIAAEAAFVYQQKVINALEEAESALAAYSGALDSASQIRFAVEKHASIDRLENERFKRGLVSLTNTIDTKLQLLKSKQDLLDKETTVLIDMISVYKAMGGGWEPFQP